MEGQRRLALARLAATGDDPDVLHGPASEHPAEMELTAGGARPTGGVDTRPGDIPRADELTEQLQLLGVRARGTRDVQRFDQAICGHRHSSGLDERRAPERYSLDCRWGGTGLVADPVFKTGRAS